MVKYNKANVQLSYWQLNELKNAVESQTGVKLRMSIKIFKGNNLLHEYIDINPIQDGLFWSCSRMGCQKGLLP